MLYSRPGSLTVYTTAPRQGILSTSETPETVGPNSYTVDNHCIKTLDETVAPFDTTEERKTYNCDENPGPGSYNPEKLPQNASGTIGMLWGDRFPCNKYDTPGAGPGDPTGDPWEMRTAEIYHQCNTMRPRVKYPKHVSNNTPSVFHPLDIRCFIQGGDHRMYPWRKPKRINTQPGPIYDIFKIYTSLSKVPPMLDFSKNAERGDVFKPKEGAGPAEYYTAQPLNPNGGIFLSKSTTSDESCPRLMDLVMREASKPHPGPADHCIPRDFDCPSRNAVSAPFKSTVPILGFPDKVVGPGPQAYFRTDMTVDDLEYPLWGYPRLRLPPRAPFLTTACRFRNSETREACQRPPPNRYHIRSFTDDMCRSLWKHRPAVCNPRLGFLTSAEARQKEIAEDYHLDAIRGRCDTETVPGKWRNLRPKKYPTYPYHCCPEPSVNSPGPIYETASGMKAIKAKRDWFAPRGCSWTAFNNSGCGRKTLDTPDPDIPGPKYLIPAEPSPGGNIKTTGERTASEFTDSPGPKYVLHEKGDSVWRGTQLGTFNTHLKGLGTLRPSAGGFHPHGPIDDLADREGGYLRLEDCLEAYKHQPKTKKKRATQTR